VTYSDATWAEDRLTEVYLWTSSSTLWRSYQLAPKKQATVALSTAEAEFIALAASVQEVIFFAI